MNKKTDNFQKIPAILLFGPPGSGKGMLGKFLAAAGTQYHLTSQEIFPAEKKGNMSEDAELQWYQSRILEIIQSQAFSPEKQDLLLEGVPYTLKQAEILSRYLNVRHIIVLEVEDAEALLSRKKPEEKDLDLEKMKKSLEHYGKQLQEVLSFYPSHLISKINAQQPPLEVFREVLVRLAHLLSPPTRTPKETS